MPVGQAKGPCCHIPLVKHWAAVQVLHMQSGAGDAIKLTDPAFKNVAFTDDRKDLVSDADVVLAVQLPALDVISAMKEGAILISFIYADKEPAWCSAYGFWSC
jgi:NAD/NADP transhydrogenase alpha subunit